MKKFFVSLLILAGLLAVSADPNIATAQSTPISGLPNASPYIFQNGDYVPIVRSGVTYKATPYQVPTSGQLLLSSGSGISPTGLPEVDGSCPTGVNGMWTVQPCITGASITGSPSSGNLTIFATSSSITNGNISGDCTTSGSTAITCTKTGGVAFGSLATSNTAPAGTLTGTTLNSTVVNSSLTHVGALSSGSLTTGFTAVGLAQGGTNASLTASNGGLFYSTGSAAAILSGTSTANQIPLSGSSAAPAWSTATYPATTTANNLLYSSAANTIANLATANSGILVTSSGGVPSIGTALPNGVTATTQAAADNSTKVATDAFVLANSTGAMTAYAVGSIILAQPTTSNTGFTAGTGIAGSSLNGLTTRTTSQFNAGLNSIQDTTSLAGTWNPLSTAPAYVSGYVQGTFQRTN